MRTSGRTRSNSFANVDESEASGILTDVLAENNVFLGGSSLGKGLPKAARYYFKQKEKVSFEPYHFQLPGAKHILENAKNTLIEDSFYVVDLGVVVSQVYQWRRFFPRVEPFYAVKCNPDHVIIKTLAILGCNFDCASRNEFNLVHELTADLPRKPDIIFANPCKPRSHLIEAVCKGITMVTFDNAVEIEKCAGVSKSIELVLRIITDDRGSQCRLSSKFGAPRAKWESLLAVAHKHGMKVVGVSFHVGSGCRDASRYEAALRDTKEIFDLAESKFGMKMHLVDIGGGFPGETHSLWNPAEHIAVDGHDEDDDHDEEEDGKDCDGSRDRFMFFTEIAEQVAPVLDRLFPVESGVRIIGEPGRYFVAAAATLCCSVVSARHNIMDDGEDEKIDDAEYSQKLNELSREEEQEVVRQHARTLSNNDTDDIMQTIHEELADYSKLFASQMLTQQEVDIYSDKLDLYGEGFVSALDQLGPPNESQLQSQHHTVEGMNYQLVTASTDDALGEPSGLLTLAAAGEAAVNGVVIQAVADSAPLQDDYAYYISDGVYGAFNNIMFDHATCRPRVLRTKRQSSTDAASPSSEGSSSGDEIVGPRHFYTSTIFGPTCDSIDVICRSVLLPKLVVGDWLYFTNMGAYTMAAASSFNGFTPSEKFYVCSVMPEYFEAMIAGPEAKLEPDSIAEVEEKKEER